MTDRAAGVRGAIDAGLMESVLRISMPLSRPLLNARPRPSPWRATQPRVETRLRYAERTCHRSNWECGLVRAHDPDDPDGSVPVLRANQATDLKAHRAPDGAACCHAAGARTARGRARQVQQSHPIVGHLSDWILPPRRGSIGRSAQTRGQDRRGHGQPERDRPIGNGTQVKEAVGNWASLASLVRASGCPPNRGNPNSDVIQTQALNEVRCFKGGPRLMTAPWEGPDQLGGSRQDLLATRVSSRCAAIFQFRAAQLRPRRTIVAICGTSNSWATWPSEL